MNTQLIHDVGSMCFNRFYTDIQQFSNFSGFTPFRNLLQYLCLTGGKVFKGVISLTDLFGTSNILINDRPGY